MERKIREVRGERKKNRVGRAFVHFTSGSPRYPGKPDLYAPYIHLRL